MNSYTIITLKPDQWQEYKNIRLESLNNEPQAFFTTFQEDAQKPDIYWQERLIKAQEGNNNWLLFAKEEDRIIGIIGAFINEDEEVAHVISLYVTNNSRGKGVSKALMRSILQELEKKTSLKKIRLAVNIDQTSAIHLYKSFNFHIVEKKKSLLGDGNDHDEFTMTKTLR